MISTSLLKPFPWRAPTPEWEPGAWMMGKNIGVYATGNDCWHVVQFTPKRIQIWDYGWGALVTAIADARRCVHGRKPMAEPDCDIAL